MRNIYSIQQQIKANIISGDLANVLINARLAYTRNERELLSKNIKAMSIANVLSVINEYSRVSNEQLSELKKLILLDNVGLAGAMIIIREAINNPSNFTEIPSVEVIEILSALAADQDNLTDKELINAAHALVK